MKKYFIPAGIMTIVVFTACTKGGDYQTLKGAGYTATAVMDGAKLVPATVNDTTKADLAGWYDEEVNGFTFTLTYKKDTSLIKLDTLTAIQFYKNEPTAGNTPVRSLSVSAVINATGKTNITGSFNRGLSGATGIASEDVPAFLDSQWYVVLTSRKFPAGVAGGQVRLFKK